MALRAALEVDRVDNPVLISSVPDSSVAERSDACSETADARRVLEPPFETPGHHAFGAAHELALYSCATDDRKRVTVIGSLESGSDRELFSIFKTLRQ